MSTVNLVQLDDLGGDFVASGGVLINHAVLEGAGDPPPAPPPPVTGKVWLWVNMTTGKISHYWNAVTLTWDPTVDDDILTRYTWSGTSFPAITPDNIQAYTTIPFLRSDIGMRCIYNEAQGVWTSAQFYEYHYARNDSTTLTGDPVHFVGLSGIVNETSVSVFSTVGNITNRALIAWSANWQQNLNVGDEINIDLETDTGGLTTTLTRTLAASETNSTSEFNLWVPTNRSGVSVRYQGPNTVSDFVVALRFVDIITF